MKGVDFELRRKIVHLLVAIGLAALMWYVKNDRVVLLQLLVLGIVISLLEKRFRIPLISDALDLFERKKERKEFPGKPVIMMVAGVLIGRFFFDPFVVIAGLIVLAVGDPIAHLVGRKWGRIAIPWDKTKHLEGRLAGALISFALMIWWWELVLYTPYGLLFSAAAIGMLAETLPWKKVGLDDNIVIPLVVSFIIYFNL